MKASHKPSNAPKGRGQQAVTDTQLAAMFSAIDELRPELEKSYVVGQALLDCLQRWRESGLPNEGLAKTALAGFGTMLFQNQLATRAKYDAVLSCWSAISPGLSRYMAHFHGTQNRPNCCGQHPGGQHEGRPSVEDS